MGCYGIRLGRVMGSVVEAYADEKGSCGRSNRTISVPLANLSVDDGEVSRTARLLDEFTQKGIEFFMMIAQESAGESSKIVISWVFHIVLSFRKNSCQDKLEQGVQNDYV